MSNQSLFDLSDGTICGLTPKILAILVRLLTSQPHSYDNLPYTPEFDGEPDGLVAKWQTETGRKDTPRELALLIVKLRKHKSKPLPKRGCEHRHPSPFSRSEAGFLLRLYDEQPLCLDELAYTEEFERIVAEFRHRTHKLWTRLQVLRGLRNLRRSRLLPTKGRTKREQAKVAS